MFQINSKDCRGIPRIVTQRKQFAVVIDQFDSMDFNLNPAGWPQNSISQLARAQSKSEYDAIMARLVELKQEGGLSPDVNIQEAIDSIKPRWCQSPNEIEQFVQLTNGSVMTKLNEAYEKSVKGSVKEVTTETTDIENAE